jgi:hypothetical protein
MSASYRVLLFVMLSGTITIAAKNANSTLIHGHIVAFRPAEIINQDISGVVNRETFLMSVTGKNNQIVKIVYEHGGYSEISESNDGMTLKVRRDRSCDEDYGQYVMQEPILTSEDKEIVIPRITMLGSFNGLPASYKLKCYRLKRGNIHMDGLNN